MYSPITIANYFIKKYACEDSSLTPMKIIKLTYIAYGWYLALTQGKQELVSEKAQAWDLGPVMPTLYRKLKINRGNKVAEPIQLPPGFEEKTITEIDSNFLDFIWRKYGKFTGMELSAITHTQGTPWSETYPKGTNLEIPNSLIQQHYTTLMNELIGDNNAVTEKTEHVGG
ncbi:Panacea domain-containing protein [Flavobacterium qiangtangense]|uniref:Panacea domain-containing protein n=1 Tax=Flavobacterium qiangtangense TaxID=1442595 RepID=A0ABW1PJR3_9FLAO